MTVATARMIRWGALLAGIVMVVSPSQAATVLEGGQGYVATLVCGKKLTSGQHGQADVTSGEYGTTINITNPTQAEVCVNMYVSLKHEQRVAKRGPESPHVLERIGAQESVGVDCDDMKQLFSPKMKGFIEGSLILELLPDPVLVPPGTRLPELNVVSVYTAKKRKPRGAVQKEWDVEVINVAPVTPFEIYYKSTDTKTFPCPAPNVPPLAVDDAAAVDAGQLVIIDLAANDSDSDDGLDLASIVVVGAPANGSVLVNPDGTVDYTHDGSATASDSFSYTIADLSGAVSNVATVTLTVNP